MKTKLDIAVKGMHCKRCAEIIKDRMSKLEGIEKAEASYPEESVRVVFDSGKISEVRIGEELARLGFQPKGAGNTGKSGTTLKEGIIYGLTPHIGCIGFIIGSIFGVTIAIELFRPLLMNPWFFHILVLLSLAFATVSSAFYLRKNGVLSVAGLKRKKKYLATMYGSTVGINLLLFLLVFPLLANLDTGSFSNPTGAVVLATGDTAAPGATAAGDSLLRLQVNIPCPGHAPLISGELKTIEGVTGVRFDFPNYFDVAFDSGKASKADVLSLEVFDTYNATVVSESIAASASADSASFEAVKEVETVSQAPATTAGSCGGGCGGGGCGTGSCGCGAR